MLLSSCLSHTIYLFYSFYLLASFWFVNIFQLCSGITRGRVLNGELYTQILQKLIYLHLFPDCFKRSVLNQWNKHNNTPYLFLLWCLWLMDSLSVVHIKWPQLMNTLLPLFDPAHSFTTYIVHFALMSTQVMTFFLCLTFSPFLLLTFTHITGSS